MVAINNSATFVCKHGKVYKTLDEAIECDLTQIIQNAVTASKKFSLVAEQERLGASELGMSNPLADAVFHRAAEFEMEVILHWVINHSHVLEEMITFALDTKAQFEKLPALKPEEE